jgi:hypothetical protein
MCSLRFLFITNKGGVKQLVKASYSYNTGLAIDLQHTMDVSTAADEYEVEMFLDDHIHAHVIIQPSRGGGKIPPTNKEVLTHLGCVLMAARLWTEASSEFATTLAAHALMVKLEGTVRGLVASSY